MGCCLSTKKPQQKSPKRQNSSSFLKKHDPNTKSPPQPPTHPLPEEETVVKEVLSETPILVIPQNAPPKEPLNLKHSSPKAELHQNDVVSQEPEKVFPNKKLPLSEEFSEEVSEICSTMSESCVSTATAATATTETNNYADDDNDVTQIKNRSPAKYRNRQASRDRFVGRVQNRRSENLTGRVRPEASPGRVRPGPGRDGRGQSNGNGMRRGPVMGPERRSRSPVTRLDGTGSRTGLGRCPSGRRTGKSPGRFGVSELAEKNPKLEQANPKVENGGSSSIGDTESKLDPSNDESLENPHVSLECFIFL